jgi:CRISPR system Cascade subunit CasD
MMAVQPFLLLRLEAPLMAFGGPVVDQIGRTRSFPGRAQITGLLANALGWRHGDFAALEALQERVRMAAAVVREGELLHDYQTVDLGRPHLAGRGWTTRGRVESRAGASSDTTHIRHRWYVADGTVLIALTLSPADASPTPTELAEALRRPARPLFIGRKTCLPTAPLLLAELEAGDAIEALRRAAALWAGENSTPARAMSVSVEMDAGWEPPVEVGEVERERLVDGRDWTNQVHVRERGVCRFVLPLDGEARP